MCETVFNSLGKMKSYLQTLIIKNLPNNVFGTLLFLLSSKNLKNLKKIELNNIAHIYDKAISTFARNNHIIELEEIVFKKLTLLTEKAIIDLFESKIVLNVKLLRSKL